MKLKYALSHTHVLALLMLASAACWSACNTANKSSDDYISIQFPTYDSTKFDPIDKASGKMFDILSSKTTGLDFSNQLGYHIGEDNYQYNYYYNGAGVAVLNANGDSLPDLFFTGNISPNRLFINEGNMHFKDVTAQAGFPLKGKGWCTGVSIVDINNDGLDDIYICRSRYKDSLSKQLWINNGDGTFSEHAKDYGIDAPNDYTIMANFFDYDRDGDLDLFLANHPTDWNDKMRFNNFEKVEAGSNQTDRLFRNDNGHFVDVSKQAGINTHGFSLSCTAADITGDGWPDIYVPNDFAMYDYFFVNQKNGTFKESTRDMLKRTSLFGMGSDVGDINNDGYLDIMVADMKFDHSYQRRSFMLSQRRNEFNNMVEGGYFYQYVSNMLQLNNGNGTFTEISNLAGVDATEWSWSPLIADFDNDGWQDIFMTNGYFKTFNIDERELYQDLKDATRRGDSATYNKIQNIINHKQLRDPKVMFKNNGDLTFTRETNNWGFFQPSITHGAAFADLDGDGDLDIVTNNTNESALVYRNNESQMLHNHFIEFKFKGQDKNIKGIGAEVKIFTKNGMQFQSNHVVRGYQSCSEDLMHFGLGDGTSVDKLIVKWPDGKQQLLQSLPADHIFTLNYKDAVNKNFDDEPKPAPLFSDAAQKLKVDFVHQENSYNDFAKELLLPQKYSTLGPGLAVGDVNGDGLDDFYVTGAMGQAGILYIQQPNGTFDPMKNEPWDKDTKADQLGALFFDADGDGDLDLYVASGGDELPVNDPAYVDHLYINDGKGRFTEAPDGTIPDVRTSGSCVVASDYDNDGKMDLFIGGRITPQHYPQPTRCTILHNDGGKFTDVTDQVAPMLEKAGMVCSALWTDFNNDGKPDLILAGEWMPLTFLQNDGGKFEDVTKQLGFENTNGWWNSIVAGDFDNDGDVDYIVGNEGLNTRYYKPTADQPVDCFSADFDHNGTNDIVMAFYNYGKEYPTKNLQYSAEEMPMLAKKYPTYSGFALSTVQQIYGPMGLDNAYHLQAKTLASAYIENEGNGKFMIKPLPNRAQVSCIYGMVPMDVNGDGNLDLVYQGNYFNKESETERNDGFVGEVLLGDGHGSFSYLPSRLSGFFNDKDARALALIYDGKEKKPVIIGTNNNNKMIAFELTQNGMSEIAYTQNDRYADIEFKDGRKQRNEFSFGNGYLSQNAMMMSFMPSLVDKITITDYKGQQRVVFGSAATAMK